MTKTDPAGAASPAQLTDASRGVRDWRGETYQQHVKVTFAKGDSLEDPSGLFNAGLDGNARRAIDLREGDAISEDAFGALIRATVSLNESSARAR